MAAETAHEPHPAGGHEAHGGSAIVAALGANLGIALAKVVAFVFTGSSSMLAEAVHSFADSGNQVLLLVGGRRARKAADDDHPFGYGRQRFFYAFLVSVVLFVLGAAFAVYEGVEKIRVPHHLDSPVVAVGVLVVAIGLEGFSLRTAVRESRPLKGGATWWQFVRRAKVPELPVVLLEDTAALTGLVLALLGVGLAEVTGDPVWDGIGTLSIGLLLGLVAVVLAIETSSLLLGESAAPASVSAIRAALVGPGVSRVIHLRTQHLGPDEVMVGAKIALAGDLDVPGVAAAIDAAEARVRAVAPDVTVMYLEPDVYRT